MNKFRENLKRIWSKITESKLNISIVVAGVIVFVLLAVIIGIIIHRDGMINNELIVTVEKKDENTSQESQTSQAETKDNNETTTESEEQYSTMIDENETTNVVYKASILSPRVYVENRWTNDGEYFIQYCIEVTNISDNDIDGWALVLDMGNSYTMVDSWNYTFKEGIKKLIINPLNDNRKIPAGETVSGGFIVKGYSNIYVDYVTVYVGNIIETIKNGSTYIPPASNTGRPIRDYPSDDTTTVNTQPSENENPVNGENPDNRQPEPTPENPDNRQPKPTPENPDNRQPEPTPENPDNRQPEPTPENPDNRQPEPTPENPDNGQPKPTPENPDNQQAEPNKPTPTITSEIITSAKTEIITPEN